jgi:hypothetical protein
MERSQRQRYAHRAAELLRNEEVFWLQGSWIAEIHDGGAELDSRLTGGSRLGAAREWLTTFGFGARNKRCGVCAEGALMIALAEDAQLPDDVVIRDFLREFDQDAARAAETLGLVDDHRSFAGITDYNDETADDAEAVIRLFNQMGAS